MSKNQMFSDSELQKIIHAVHEGGTRKGTEFDAFDILESYGEAVVLDKFDSLSVTTQK